jgi:hypothetical protein
LVFLPESLLLIVSMASSTSLGAKVGWAAMPFEAMAHSLFLTVQEKKRKAERWVQTNARREECGRWLPASLHYGWRGSFGFKAGLATTQHAGRRKML